MRSRNYEDYSTKELFEVLRHEILCSRLNVALDQELKRPSSAIDKRLSSMSLPPQNPTIPNADEDFSPGELKSLLEDKNANNKSKTVDSSVLNRADTHNTGFAAAIVETKGDDENKQWTVSDETLQEELSGHSVDDVNGLLDEIVNDKSVKRKERHHAVSRIVGNQPHETTEFKKYNMKNQVVRDDLEITWMFPSLVASLSSSLLGALMFYMSSFEGLAGLMGVGMLMVGGIFPLFSIIGLLSLRTLIHHNKSTFYYQREGLSLQDFIEQEKERKKNEIKQAKQHLTQLSMEISDTPVLSISQVKEDYQSALFRIASYETDLELALKYPAFNDITIPETRSMIKQLRHCKNLFENLRDHSVEVFSKEVDELWICIQTAQEKAKRIGLKSLSSDEVKLLNKVKNLASHAEDSSYSEEVRAHFYQQLKTTIDRLNTSRTVVPHAIVGEIEHTAMLLIPQKENARFLKTVQ